MPRGDRLSAPAAVRAVTAEAAAFSANSAQHPMKTLISKPTLSLLALACCLSGCVVPPEAMDALAANASRPAYYPPPQVHPYRATSDYYSSGYYPYSRPAPTQSVSSQKAHAYDVGYRVGQDDFHHNRSKHMDQHKNLYDSATHDAFRDGYEAGYDAARRRGKR